MMDEAAPLGIGMIVSKELDGWREGWRPLLEQCWWMYCQARFLLETSCEWMSDAMYMYWLLILSIRSWWIVFLPYPYISDVDSIASVVGIVVEVRNGIKWYWTVLLYHYLSDTVVMDVQMTIFDWPLRFFNSDIWNCARQFPQSDWTSGESRSEPRRGWALPSIPKWTVRG